MPLLLCASFLRVAPINWDKCVMKSGVIATGKYCFEKLFYRGHMKMIGRKKGFTLVELMVVIAVIAILGLISGANMAVGLPKYRVRNCATDLSSKLRKARSKAIKMRRNITVAFDLANSRYIIEGSCFPVERNGQPQSLSDYYGSKVSYGAGNPGKSNFVTFGGKRVTFNSRGLSNPGSVCLENNKGDSYRGVANTSGRIRVQHWVGKRWE